MTNAHGTQKIPKNTVSSKWIKRFKIHNHIRIKKTTPSGFEAKYYNS